MSTVNSTTQSGQGASSSPEPVYDSNYAVTRLRIAMALSQGTVVKPSSESSGSIVAISNSASNITIPSGSIFSLPSGDVVSIADGKVVSLSSGSIASQPDGTVLSLPASVVVSQPDGSFLVLATYVVSSSSGNGSGDPAVVTNPANQYFTVAPRMEEFLLSFPEDNLDAIISQVMLIISKTNVNLMKSHLSSMDIQAKKVSDIHSQRLDSIKNWIKKTEESNNPWKIVADFFIALFAIITAISFALIPGGQSVSVSIIAGVAGFIAIAFAIDAVFNLASDIAVAAGFKAFTLGSVLISFFMSILNGIQGDSVKKESKKTQAAWLAFIVNPFLILTDSGHLNEMFSQILVDSGHNRVKVGQILADISLALSVISTIFLLVAGLVTGGAGTSVAIGKLADTFGASAAKYSAFIHKLTKVSELAMTSANIASTQASFNTQNAVLSSRKEVVELDGKASVAQNSYDNTVTSIKNLTTAISMLNAGWTNIIKSSNDSKSKVARNLA